MKKTGDTFWKRLREKRKYYTYKPGEKYTGKDEFVKKTVDALNRTTEADDDKIIDKLSESPKVTKILEYNSGSYTYKKRGEAYVMWNSEQGIEFVDKNNERTGEYISSGLNLYHELGHAYIKLLYTKAQKKKMRSDFNAIKDSRFGKAEEKEIITKFERRAAIKLGEPVRDTHFGYSKTVRTTTEHSNNKK